MANAAQIEEMGEEQVKVIITDKGTLGPGGIEPLGLKTIPCRQFSGTWMKPADKTSGAKINRYVEALVAAKKRAASE